MQRGVRASGGFTLLEVMIVIVIILAIAGLVTVNLMSSRTEATKGTVQVQLKSLRDGLKQFNLTFNRFPTDEEGIGALWDKSKMTSDEDSAKWRPFMDEPMANDPWGSPWGYRAQGERAPEGMFDLWSNGPDKQEGTDDDISVWRQVTDEAGSERPGGGSTRPTPGG